MKYRCEKRNIKYLKLKYIEVRVTSSKMCVVGSQKGKNRDN